ncbi:GtrA family protein [Oerskovia enterophila]|uniref:GtrA family protein n=1 Tax=Oerskovia enterophila TaxID=43678 RepID=UPI001CD83769
MPDERPGDGARASVPPAIGPKSAVRRLVQHPLVKYLVVGGLSFLVDAGLLWLCTSLLGWAVWLGATIGFWTGVLVNFTLNRIVMNRDKSSLLTQTSRYGVLLAFNYVVTLGILHLTTSWGVPVVVAKTAIVAGSTCWNYVLYRLWVFA